MQKGVLIRSNLGEIQIDLDLTVAEIRYDRILRVTRLKFNSIQFNSTPSIITRLNKKVETEYTRMYGVHLFIY